jgi:hypothetical protein
VRKLRAAYGAVLLVLFFGAAAPAAGQVRRTTPETPPPQIDPATIPMPDLSFTPTPQVAENFDKYFYFNRAGTDFMTAYADLRECDGYARGLAYRTAYIPYYAPGLLTSAIGGAIGSVVSDMIFGSAQRRLARRINMLTCMRFKEYRVFGLPENLWERFNFEEGNRQIPEEERQRLLRLQARVASGPAPTVGEIMP